MRKDPPRPINTYIVTNLDVAYRLKAKLRMRNSIVWMPEHHRASWTQQPPRYVYNRIQFVYRKSQASRSFWGTGKRPLSLIRRSVPVATPRLNNNNQFSNLPLEAESQPFRRAAEPPRIHNTPRLHRIVVSTTLDLQFQSTQS